MWLPSSLRRTRVKCLQLYTERSVTSFVNSPLSPKRVGTAEEGPQKKAKKALKEAWKH